MGAEPPPIDPPLLAGARAPELGAHGLTGAHGGLVRLADLSRDALLVFLPFAFSPVCTDELAALGAGLRWFDDAGVRVVGISCDAPATLRAWTREHAGGIELLSDFWPHGQAARAYGVFDAAHGHARRGTFLVRDGRVRWSVLTDAGSARDVAAYRAAVASL
ncbi:redoxin domain-containing protein [Cellulomonas sp. PhB143]|uniref:redoxin domain-containing protein n=1 Tax=Cellulomonas sp. PhB143 TaxID=2485186 RepID=UPI000FC0C3C4|nr:redoxin domain-containing protein [Cellulomonas sp. PhB143]ROS73704.1 peroxiredoxin [Cellulomonas sp. PhB143]